MRGGHVCGCSRCSSRFRDAQWPQAAAFLGAYSASGLVSALHYTDISVSDLNAFQNTFVFADIALGAAVLAFALWTALDPPTAAWERGLRGRRTAPLR